MSSFKIHEEYIDMFIAWQEGPVTITHKDNGYYIVVVKDEESK